MTRLGPSLKVLFPSANPKQAIIVSKAKQNIASQVNMVTEINDQRRALNRTWHTHTQKKGLGRRKYNESSSKTRWDIYSKIVINHKSDIKMMFIVPNTYETQQFKLIDSDPYMARIPDLMMFRFFSAASFIKLRVKGSYNRSSDSSIYSQWSFL